MKHEHGIDRDVVDCALARLRADVELPAPDPRLEARLLRTFERRRVLRPLPFVLATLGLSSVALAAGGAEWLRGLWYEVRVGERVASGELGTGGLQVVPFETDGGDTGTVSIRRDRNGAGNERTRIEIDRRGENAHDVELAERVDGDPVLQRLPRTAVDGGERIFAGTDAAGSPFELFVTEAVAQGDVLATRLLVLREDGSALPVVEIARVPLDPSAFRQRARASARPGGGCVLALGGERGVELELVWLGGEDTNTSRGATELATPDGEIRVRVEDADRR